MSYTVLSQTTIQVTWKKPEVDNGEISEYRLKVTAYTDGQVLFTYSINASVELTVTVENLGKALVAFMNVFGLMLIPIFKQNP